MAHTNDECWGLDEVERFWERISKKPAGLVGIMAAAVSIAVVTLAWPVVTSPPPQPTPPSVIVVSVPAPQIIVVAPAPPLPALPQSPTVAVNPPLASSSVTPVVRISAPAPAPQPQPAPQTPRCRAAAPFRDGHYGGFELVGVNHSNKTVTVKLPSPSAKKEVEVPTLEDAQVFQANDYLGDFSSLRSGQKLSMYLRKKADDEVVASAIFIERFR
jgi:hypothetical protein